VPKDREAVLSQFVFVLKITDKRSFYPYVLREVSVLTELLLGHLRYRVTDVPPQPNSPPDYVFDPDRGRRKKGKEREREDEVEGRGRGTRLVATVIMVVVVVLAAVCGEDGGGEQKRKG